MLPGIEVVLVLDVVPRRRKKLCYASKKGPRYFTQESQEASFKKNRRNAFKVSRCYYFLAKLERSEKCIFMYISPDSKNRAAAGVGIRYLSIGAELKSYEFALKIQELGNTLSKLCLFGQGVVLQLVSNIDF